MFFLFVLLLYRAAGRVPRCHAGCGRKSGSGRTCFAEHAAERQQSSAAVSHQRRLSPLWPKLYPARLEYATKGHLFLLFFYVFFILFCLPFSETIPEPQWQPTNTRLETFYHTTQQAAGESIARVGGRRKEKLEEKNKQSIKQTNKQQSNKQNNLPT
jgi:hypothetical protein